LHDMYLSDVEETDAHGGSLRATVQKKGFGKVPTKSVASHIEYEARALTPESLTAFGDEALKQIVTFKNTLKELKAKGLKVAGFGSPARVSTLCNFGEIGPDLIEYIIDETPLKQNKFSPGTHIPILPMAHLKSNKPDVFIVFVHEYFDVVKKKLTKDYRFFFPVPVREVH
jgi:methylation protein EvaC